MLEKKEHSDRANGHLLRITATGSCERFHTWPGFIPFQALQNSEWMGAGGLSFLAGAGALLLALLFTSFFAAMPPVAGASTASSAAAAASCP